MSQNEHCILIFFFIFIFCSTELKGESCDGSPIVDFDSIPFNPQNFNETLKIFDCQNCDSTFFKIRRKKKLHEEKNSSTTAEIKSLYRPVFHSSEKDSRKLKLFKTHGLRKGQTTY